MEDYNHSANLDFDIDNSEIEPEEKIIKKGTSKKSKKETEKNSTAKVTKKRTSKKSKKEDESETEEKVVKKRISKKIKKDEEEDIEEHIEFKNTENIQQQILQTPSKYLKVETLNTQNVSSQSTIIENEIDNIKTQIKELTIENNDLKLKLTKMETRLNNIINQFIKPSQNNDLQIDTELSYILNSE